MAQDLIALSNLARVRDLKAANARLAAENKRLREEMASLKAHFGLALTVTEDLKSGGSVELWDGWNLILGAKKEAADREDLIRQAKSRAGGVWIVFDGRDENIAVDGNVRVSYTGGEGPQRADRFICDYLRMAKCLGLADAVTVRSNDRKLLKEAAAIKGRGGGE
jgi:hypothetical protein